MCDINLRDDLHAIAQMNNAEIDIYLSSILYKSGLSKDNNDFFIRANNIENINLVAAFNIAYNWREITKTFLFTSIGGLGDFAEKLGEEVNTNSQSPSFLSVLPKVIHYKFVGRWYFNPIEKSSTADKISPDQWNYDSS